MYKKLYSRFLEANPHDLFFTAHSHHFWPDCSRDAQIKYWDDSAKYVDDKWGEIFSNVLPKTQKFIASNLNLQNPSQIAFAPNTHELGYRLISCFDWNKEIKVLTTDSEFHSFNRQIDRLSEMNHFKINKVSQFPVETFEERFLEEAKNNHYDLIFVSHVFFNTGKVFQRIHELSEVANKESIICIDGYHAYMAIPTDISALEGRAFYLGGGYKYAQAGEGVCFMVVPKGHWRPHYTGWIAEFGDLSQEQIGNVQYSSDAMAFAGATFEPTPFYRFNAVQEMLEIHNLDTSKVDIYIKSLQRKFLDLLNTSEIKELKEALLFKTPQEIGHFVTFKMKDTERANLWQKSLREAHIWTDSRGPYLRFGFGLFLEESDIQKLFKALNNLTL